MCDATETKAVGMRPMGVSVDEAADLRRMAKANSAPPKIEPRPVPLVDRPERTPR